jgi:hypothetical protein
MFKFLASLCCVDVLLPSFLRHSPRTKKGIPTQVAQSPTPDSSRSDSHRLQGTATEKKPRLQGAMITHMGLAPTNPFANYDPFKGSESYTIPPSSLVILPSPPRGSTCPSGDRRTSHSRRNQQRNSHKPLKRRAILAYKRWRQTSRPRASGRFSYVPPGFTMIRPDNIALQSTAASTGTVCSSTPTLGDRRSSDATVVQLPMEEKGLWKTNKDESASTANGACCEPNHHSLNSVEEQSLGRATPETFATARSDSYCESPIAVVGITPPTSQTGRFSASISPTTTTAAEYGARRASFVYLADEQLPQGGLGTREQNRLVNNDKDGSRAKSRPIMTSTQAGDRTVPPKPFFNRPLSPLHTISRPNNTITPPPRPLRHATRRDLRFNQ